MVDYDYYISDYHGSTIPVELFEYLEDKAAHTVNLYTFNRAGDSALDEVKLCVCALAELYNDAKDMNGVKSVNTDGYSVTYEEKAIQNLAYDIVTRYLLHTDLLNMGV